MGHDLKLGLGLGYWAKQPDDATEAVLAAEEVGFDSVWAGEAYGSDALTPLTWYAARTTRIKIGTSIIQLDARTPANAAMAAMTLDALSQGRLMLGLGVSGPQIVEGWYGRPFPKPLARTREYVEIMRRIWDREEPLTHEGEFFPLPHPGGAGLGKPLRLITEPFRPRVPVYLGAQGPKNVALAVEIGDGWLPAFVHVDKFQEMYGDALVDRRPDLDIVASVNTFVDDDLKAAFRRAKEPLAWYVGGMGAKGANFHYDAVTRAGFGQEAERIQELFLAGRRDEAVDAVPDELVDGTSLIGSPKRIKERLERWQRSEVDTVVMMGLRDTADIRALAKEIDL
ncbi:LLM class F420-dependent oxidoreductase [Nocardioides houyundeii]|uniref:LLM class F420-dependent oxidoreductase n=1 Tax=Nocardioides houyundeii TaxID=2045452 RepID=UPI000DF4B93A|nr:LLM class F420-dependent oxidoreductase [Nocardioides houyundeii]